MAELTVDILELALKQVRKACSENKECDGCKFLKHISSGKLDYYSCGINGEPYNWEFADDEGSEEDEAEHKC